MTTVNCERDECAYNKDNICQAEEITMEADYDWSEGCRRWDTESFIAQCKTNTVPTISVHRHGVVVYKDEEDEYGNQLYDVVPKDEYFKKEKEEWLRDAYHCPDCNAMFGGVDTDRIWEHEEKTGHEIDPDWLDGLHK